MKNKILTIFSLILIILLSACVNCFAVSFPELPYENEERINFVFSSNGQTKLAKIKSGYTSDIEISVTNDNKIYVVAKMPYDVNYYNLNGDTWSYSYTANGDSSNSYRYLLGDTSTISVLYCNKDIYREDGKIFFPPAPVTLAETLEATNPIQMWKEQMKNVVVSLAVFLAGLVAFLKAWAWLKTQLRQA